MKCPLGGLSGQTLFEIAATTSTFLACFLIFTWTSSKPVSDSLRLVGAYLATLQFPTLVYLALAHVLRTFGTLEGRWHETSVESHWFLVVYVSTMIAEVPGLVLCRRPGVVKVQLLVHHAASVFCFLLGLGDGVAHFFGCLDGCSEVSTVFLNNAEILKDLRATKWMQILNAMLLLASFVVFRILLFSLWLFVFFSDVATRPGTTLGCMYTVAKVIYPATNVMLLALSTHWFRIILAKTRKEVRMFRGRRE